MDDFESQQLPHYLELVNQKLIQTTEACSPALYTAASRFIGAKGKRLRPSLVLAIASSGGREVDDKVITAAAAIELVHIGSLVHDDIMDHGKLRWGIETVNSKEGLNTAILVGDYFLAKACSLASSVGSKAGVVVANTIAEMTEGQSLELADKFNTERTIESMLAAVKGKTSSLFSAACLLGGLCARLNDTQIKALKLYGDNFGLAYQILDDVQDFTVTPKSAGKTVGNDVLEGIYTLPVLLSIQGPNQLKLKGILKSKSVSNTGVLKILMQDNSLEKSLYEAALYSEEACSELVVLDDSSLRHYLINLALKLNT